ncbi:hypothetical protein [Comamonas sp. MYb396]|uniref:hypothetical protein n=1 Tax=Comamonas sp. MYb396 TaxID=2745302 RepID=UPI0030B79FCC
MSIKKNNKDHVIQDAFKQSAFTPVVSDNLLVFWTNHPQDNNLVDLRIFATGENEENRVVKRGAWQGPFTGRPRLIAQLASACQANCMLRSEGTVRALMVTLRCWWRLFDKIQKSHGFKESSDVIDLSSISEIHVEFARRKKISLRSFSQFLTIVNDALKANKMPLLTWSAPASPAPTRHLISEDQAKDLKIALKQEWQTVRNTWRDNDLIASSMSRDDFALNSILDKNKSFLLSNLEYFQKIQIKTGKLLPSGRELRDGRNHSFLAARGYFFLVMRGMVFPTLEEVDVAFHLALMNSGWNPATLLNLDASSDELIFTHPKNADQIVLSATGDSSKEVVMFASKSRANGKVQFCTGLEKNPNSPPAIVAALLKRVEGLRNILRGEFREACLKLENARESKLDQSVIFQHVKNVQRLKQGMRSAWLYVDRVGKINWLDGKGCLRYGPKNKSVPFIKILLSKVNKTRRENGLIEIPAIRPSDFRDIYARQVYIQSGGNILAVMLALGHSSLKSTACYIDNNIFNVESDETARRFMTHLFHELNNGRIDLTILAQLVRYGTMTDIMRERLENYRELQRSRLGVACSDPRKPPSHIAPNHKQGGLCETQRCLKNCTHARFLPESLDGLAMRVEEILALSEKLPRETWLHADLETELEVGLGILNHLFESRKVSLQREKWRSLIRSGGHLIPGYGFI